MALIQSGESSVHFNKVKPMQLAEIRSVLQRRPKNRFSKGLSPEAQEAMQQVAEESKIQQVARKGKRGSKGNVLFSDKVQIREDTKSQRRPSVIDIFEDTSVDNCYTSHIGELLDGGADNDPSSAGALTPRRHGRRRSSVSKWVTDRRGSVSNNNSEVDQVETANKVQHEEVPEEDPHEGGENAD